MAHLLLIPRRAFAWEFIQAQRDERRKREACPAAQHLLWLKRCEIAAWQALKDACAECTWFIGSEQSPYFADIQAAKAAVGE